jgi:hypothetical protein
MSFTATVTPGLVWADGTKVTIARLNQTAQPTVSISGALSQVTDVLLLTQQAKVFTVADLPLDTLTVTAHGLSQPATPAAALRAYVTNAGGALPGGLLASTTYSYYIRVVDSNTLTLHHTATGVIAGTDRVNISSSGTGTHTLRYTLHNTGAALIFNTVNSKWENGLVGGQFLVEMIGATAAADGMRGAVPQPRAGDQLKFLRGDGTYVATVVGVGNDLFLNMNVF